MSTLPFYLEDPTPEWYEHLVWSCLDFETTNVEKGDPWVESNDLVLAALAQGQCAELIPLDQLQHYLPKQGVLVAHNAKFELGWLYRSGVDITNLLPWDTMIAEYVLAGNRRWALDLGSVAKRYGFPGKERRVDALIKGGVCPSEIPRQWLEDRARYDVRTTLAIARLQFKRICDEGLLGVMYTRCITTPALALIESEGMTLDANRVEKEVELQQLALVRLERELAAISGGINLKSGKQLGEFIYGKLGFKERTRRGGEAIRTAAGKPMTDSDTLAQLKATTKEQREFIKLRGEYGKVSAKLDKALKFFSEICTNHGGVFRGKFNQCVTQTHRLSSSGRQVLCADKKRRGVQFQNLPREYKKLFKASKPGYVMAETDGAQLEFRVGGHLGKDPQILADVQSGADIHRFTASVMTGHPESEITDAQRTAAKSETFGPMYGRTHGSQKQLAYIEAFQRKYKGLNDAQNSWVAEALRNQVVRTVTGLKFYYPGTGIRQNGDITNRTNIFNHPIQSLATADIIPISLAYTFWTTRDYAKVVNTVHDSVVAEVPEKELDRYMEDVRRSWLQQTYRYLDQVYGIRLYVPLGIGVKAAKHWGDTKTELRFNE